MIKLSETILFEQLDVSKCVQLLSTQVLQGRYEGSW